jgi:hypothetical protein
LREKLPGHERGELPSSFYFRVGRDEMRRYLPLHGQIFTREWPAAWRGLDNPGI